jgi:hypothetical protein
VYVGLIGNKDGKDTTIQNITLFVDDEKEYIDFSLVFKKPSEKYDHM